MQDWVEFQPEIEDSGVVPAKHYRSGGNQDVWRHTDASFLTV